jgi:N-acetylmuramoyl-L-alanine amidase
VAKGGWGTAERVGMVATVAFAVLTLTAVFVRPSDPVDPPPSTTTTTASAPSTTPPSSTATTTTTLPPETTTTSLVVGPPVGVPDQPDLDPAAPPAALDPAFEFVGVAVVAEGGADLSEAPGSETVVRAHEGLAFPIVARDGDRVEVFTTCDTVLWADLDQLAVTARGLPARVGAGFDFGDAVIVIDAGHGGPSNIGAVGPAGTPEKEVNLDIARRVRDLLQAEHVVEWDTGRIFEGNAVPPAARVLMTRQGAEDGDYEAGLRYRAELSNAAGAHVLVSIHNNAGWEIDVDVPGSDVYYQSQVEDSRRLAAILVGELQRSFAPFDADWKGATETGAKSRLSPRDERSQYYGVLRRTDAPAVIAEGAYLSNPSEEALLRTPRFRQAYAEAVYRALIRFLTTDDTGDGASYDPEVWPGFAGSGDPTPACRIPEQPQEAAE